MKPSTQEVCPSNSTDRSTLRNRQYWFVISSTVTIHREIIQQTLVNLTYVFGEPCFVAVRIRSTPSPFSPNKLQQIIEFKVLKSNAIMPFYCKEKITLWVFLSSFQELFSALNSEQCVFPLNVHGWNTSNSMQYLNTFLAVRLMGQ